MGRGSGGNELCVCAVWVGWRQILEVQIRWNLKRLLCKQHRRALTESFRRPSPLIIKILSSETVVWFAAGWLYCDCDDDDDDETGAWVWTDGDVMMWWPQLQSAQLVSVSNPNRAERVISLTDNITFIRRGLNWIQLAISYADWPATDYAHLFPLRSYEFDTPLHPPSTTKLAGTDEILLALFANRSTEAVIFIGQSLLCIQNSSSTTIGRRGQ